MYSSIIKGDWTDHIQKLQLTLNKLKGGIIKYSTKKYFFGQTEMEYLGFWVTCDGVKPINRKIEAITNMVPPTSRKEVRNFIVLINYYHYMCPRRSHALAPFTKLISIKGNFKWTEVKKDAFDEIKRIVASNNLLTYPDFNETFKIHTDAILFQLGAVIIQKVKPIDFYSIKLNYSQ